MEERGLLEDTESMIRLKVKGKLIKDSEVLFEFLAQKEKALTGRFLRFARRQLFKDFKKGIKQINKKIAVFVELPKYEEKAPGIYATGEEIVVGKEIQPETRDIVEVPSSGIIKGRDP